MYMLFRNRMYWHWNCCMQVFALRMKEKFSKLHRKVVLPFLPLGFWGILFFYYEEIPLLISSIILLFSPTCMYSCWSKWWKQERQFCVLGNSPTKQLHWAPSLKLSQSVGTSCTSCTSQSQPAKPFLLLEEPPSDAPCAGFTKLTPSWVGAIEDIFWAHFSRGVVGLEGQ